MNLNQLHYFVETANQLSFSKAADNLFISQPALSRQIQALEETLGVRLFERSNRGLTLTPAGQLLLDESSGIFRKERELLYRLRSAGSDALPQIKIGFTNDVFSLKLNNFILHYNRNFNPQKFFLTRYNWVSLKHAMSRCSIDLAFCISNGLDGLPDLSTRTLFDAQNHIVLSKHHPLANRTSITLDELRDMTFMFPNTIFKSAPQDITQACEKYGFKPSITYEHTILESVLLEVAMGHGIAILMPGLMPPAYDADLVSIPCPDLNISKFVVAWNRNLESPQLMSIIDQILQFPWV